MEASCIFDAMFITADKIHDGKKWLPPGTVIETSDDGKILSLSDNKDVPGIVAYEGILVPGFVNVHCHLELSHMKGVVQEHTGLIPFLKTIPLHRNDFTEAQKKQARHDAYRELANNGVVAVGDIANTTDTIDVRAIGKLHMHTFIEALGFSEANADRLFGYATQNYDAFSAQREQGALLRQCIVPHAPYSVSQKMFGLIDRHNNSGLLAIHNQESREEDKYYMLKEGGVCDLLQTLGVDDSFFIPSGKSSLETYLQWLHPDRSFIFVHNTYTDRNGVQLAKNYVKQAWWCLCPNANLYIENALPDVPMLLSETENICIGTDSLASNHQLSVLSELATLKETFPMLTWESLLRWGTYNGACALQMDSIIGSIAPGLTPGILSIENIDASPVIKRIV